MDEMKTKLLLLSLPIFILSSCSDLDKGSVEDWKNEILETEKAFADMAEDLGIPQAFIYYAADDAVVNRNNRLVIGKEALRSYFGELPSGVQDEHLHWTPDFVDVSLSGDLGYTYGQYVYTYADSTGNTVETGGIFHTVWKRQADGSWRFVWD